MHAHTLREVGFDLHDAITTSRVNRRAGTKVRAPWRRKNYRPLTFTAGYGWRINAEGMLRLSFGRTKGEPATKDRKRMPGTRNRAIELAPPPVIDPLTGAPVPPSAWGEIRLCWDRDARAWSLHIAYRTGALNPLPVAVADDGGRFPANTVTVAVDPGVIHAMTLTVHDPARPDHVEALVVSARRSRSVRRLRAKTLGSLDRALSRVKNGSRRHRKLVAAKRRTKAKSNRRLADLDHKVAAAAARFVREATLDDETGEIRPTRLVVGDMRAGGKNTRKRRRAKRRQRQQFSQWSRGRQERHLADKTGLPPQRVPEQHTTQTCPRCERRAKQRGRIYSCRGCGLKIHRDVVGSGNIGSRARGGGAEPSADTPIAPWMNDDTTVSVTYRRSHHVWSPLQRELHSHAQRTLGRAGKNCVEARNRAGRKRQRDAARPAVARVTATPTTSANTGATRWRRRGPTAVDSPMAQGIA